MVKQAVDNHPAFRGCNLTVFAKGSYPNNTNVRVDSDVDIAVQFHELMYWGEATSGAHPAGGSYTGIWTPQKLRSELGQALEGTFPGQVNSTGSTAFRVNASTARVDADVVPCFDYRYYFSSSSWRDGSRVFKKDGSYVENYPQQQLDNGVAKNKRTGKSYKGAVRILKRVENAMVVSGDHGELPSFFIECLVYNCPDEILNRSTWVDTTKGIISHIWQECAGVEPSDSDARWLEVSQCKYLFHSAQAWTRNDACTFAKAAWNYLEFAS
jgi:hypothetical protein